MRISDTREVSLEYGVDLDTTIVDKSQRLGASAYLGQHLKHETFHAPPFGLTIYGCGTEGHPSCHDLSLTHLANA